MNIYRFMPDELSQLTTQAVKNVIAKMYQDGDLSDENALKWSRRAVLVREPSFIRRLFGKVFKDDGGLKIVIVERLSGDDDESEEGKESE